MIMKIVVGQVNSQVELAISVDGEIYKESHNFVDAPHAEGLMADIFNFLTGNRHSTPTKFPVKKERRLRKIE